MAKRKANVVEYIDNDVSEMTVEEWKNATTNHCSGARKAKYNNRSVIYDGYRFDSGMECERYKMLRLMQSSGDISNLGVHPLYELLPRFTDRYGIKQRSIAYELDFSYITRDGLTVVEDVKGHMLALSRLKIKWFKYRYPDIDIRIVNADGTPYAERKKTRGNRSYEKKIT